MGFLFFRSRRSPAPAAPAHAQPQHAEPHAEPMFDSLEPRLALYADPFLGNFPALSAMKNTNDTVIRMQTSSGIIDIELYDRGGPPALVTANNFLTYIKSGRLDNTFFHRMIENFVLQGGGFVDDPTTVPPATAPYSAVVTDAPIVNEYSDARKNLARTVAMAKLGGNPNSATSQFFFNLVDNTDLNTQNGGFTVFGQVIGGWTVVETISDFQTRDLNAFLGGDAFSQVPLSGPNNTDLVRIIDIEVIKPADQAQFYTETIYFPDGFRSGRIVSTVEMVNLDANASGLYQVIVRYEKNTRDTVIATGTLAAGAHLDLPVSKAGQPSLNLVKATAPFCYIIRSTTRVAATLVHKDFGATAAESFFQAEPYTNDSLKDWSFAGGQRGEGISTFIVWENLSSLTSTVTVIISPVSPDTWTPISVTQTLHPYRRGGLNLFQISGVPDGLIAIRITSTQPIVTAMSQYRAAPARATLELGVPAGGNTEGILPAAFIASAADAAISVVRTGDALSSVTIDFQFILSDGSVFTNNGTLTLNSGVRSRRWLLSSLNGALPRDEYFSVRYKVRNATEKVAMTYFSIANTDTIATPFQTVSSQEVILAGGFTDPSTTALGQETISLFSPYGTTGTDIAYRLRFHFADGTGDEIIIPAGGTGNLASRGRVDISVRSLSEVMQRINSGTQFRNYSISISAVISSFGSTFDGAVFAQLTRLDPDGNTVTFGPTLRRGTTAFFADNTIFGPP